MMNDFTKHELNFISEMMIKYHHTDLTRSNNLFIKIQSMIDDYCEHVSSPDGAYTLPPYCLKCRKEIA